MNVWFYDSTLVPRIVSVLAIWVEFTLEAGIKLDLSLGLYLMLAVGLVVELEVGLRHDCMVVY